jgi:hypothetical protein
MRRLYGVEAITSDILLATQWDSFKKKKTNTSERKNKIYDLSKVIRIFSPSFSLLLIFIYFISLSN